MSENGTGASIEFRTSDFFTRRGFASGDLLRSTMPHLNNGELRDLLVEVLQRHVLPRLDQKVQASVLPTVHNPLRATSVDGVEVTWPTPEEARGPTLTPATVTVMLEDVFACARRLRLAPAPSPDAS
jgi:hypothetical protein